MAASDEEHRQGIALIREKTSGNVCIVPPPLPGGSVGTTAGGGYSL
jgi:hypothetical protein